MTVCNGCGGAVATRFDRVLDPQTREEFTISACEQCGLGHTEPQPEDLGRYYGAEYHGGRHGLTQAYCAWRRVRLLAAAAGEPRGRRVLDVGCGDGTFLLAAQRAGWQVAGTELNPSIAREAGLDVRETIEEAAQLGPFGCITLWHSLEHFRDPKKALTTLGRLLGRGGVLLVAVPDAQGAQAKLFGARWFHLDVPRHLFHFSDRSLTQMLNAAGLVVDRRWHQELEYDMFGWSQSALNTVLGNPNVFFNRLTGRRAEAPAGEVAASLVLGSALTALSLPATAASTLAGKGGTLIAAARRAP